MPSLTFSSCAMLAAVCLSSFSLASEDMSSTIYNLLPVGPAAAAFCFSCCSAVRLTQICFCVLIAFAVARTLRSQSRFYRWFYNCGMEINKHRGFGQSACRAYGVVPNPPALTPVATDIAGLMLVATLLLSCTPLAPRCFLAAAIFFYWLFLAQFYCEAHVGAHVTVLVPPALLMFLTAPTLTADAADVSVAADMGPLVLMKLILVLSYCSAGISKLWGSVKANRFWGNGSTLQYYILEAMFLNQSKTSSYGGLPHFSFGVPTPFSYHLQQFLVSRPRLCAIMSVKALAFETLAPLILLSPSVDPYFAVAGVGFHYGIALFQNIDFVSWWGPYYCLFAFEQTGAVANLLVLFQQYYAAFPLACTVQVGYLALHLLAMAYVSVTGHEILPFSSFHMFSEPKNWWATGTSKILWLSEKEHKTGTLKNYAFPFCRPQHVKQEELPALPFKYLAIGQRQQGEMFVYTNVSINKPLQAALDDMVAEWSVGDKEYLDAKAIDRVLAKLDVAKGAFAAASKVKTSPMAEVVVGKR